MSDQNNRLFERMQEVLEYFLREEAPIYVLTQVGVFDNYVHDEIILKLHIQQRGSAKAAVHSDDRKMLPMLENKK